MFKMTWINVLRKLEYFWKMGQIYSNACLLKETYGVWKLKKKGNNQNHDLLFQNISFFIWNFLKFKVTGDSHN